MKEAQEKGVSEAFRGRGKWEALLVSSSLPQSISIHDCKCEGCGESVWQVESLETCVGFALDQDKIY